MSRVVGDTSVRGQEVQGGWRGVALRPDVPLVVGEVHTDAPEEAPVEEAVDHASVVGDGWGGAGKGCDPCK